MIYFYSADEQLFYLILSEEKLRVSTHKKLQWLFGNASLYQGEKMEGVFVGPRKEMVTPWSTNAVEITGNMSINGIVRIEKFRKAKTATVEFDPMLEQLYTNIDQHTFDLDIAPEPVKYVKNIAAYNVSEGLAMSHDEVIYLESISKKINRLLTDSEIYGFAQINSEHCRHKVFNGKFIIDGKEMPESLFALIKKTSKINRNKIVSAYTDNVAFIAGPKIKQFSPKQQDKADYFVIKEIGSVLSLKAETHNFPTTVEPFNGAATGSGGEIRDRMAGGKGSIPLAGTAVYMTSYPRLPGIREWTKAVPKRKWLYHNPTDILIKASNGASDFGNKFGQPLINGSLLTFEHAENGKTFGFDKVIMQAGGIGYANETDSLKDVPEEGDIIIVLGGDNYRIGMGGGTVSSVATGEYGQNIELNAVQRANPEMQKRAANTIRALTESHKNPIVSIHDHGAGGHLNSLSELVETTGAVIEIGKLPLGDPTLSIKEILGNESQERMGIVVKEKHLPLIEKIAARERSPLYKVGKVKNNHRLIIEDVEGNCPVDLQLEVLFGKPPKTVLKDRTQKTTFSKIVYNTSNFEEYLTRVLQLEAVACKDWLTNKVDRSVSGRVAMQQCTGPLQLPLNNLGISTLDYDGKKGIATALGHAPVSGLIDAEKGSRLAVAEALTNLLWTPIEGRLKGVSLSANWMWPAKNEGENARLYAAVKALSDFVIKLGINIPTGKDSLSMTQKYHTGDVVFAPGTVIISAVGEVIDVRKSLSPAIKTLAGTKLIFIDFSGVSPALGGSSFAQSLNKIGTTAPDVADAKYFAGLFDTVQNLIANEKILAGHDISAGGLITTLLEMNFANCNYGMNIRLDSFPEKDFIKLMFCENPGIIIQVENAEEVIEILKNAGASYYEIGEVIAECYLNITHHNQHYSLSLPHYRNIWFETSYQLDRKQSGEKHAHLRFENYKKQDLKYHFYKFFTGKAKDYHIDIQRTKPSGIKAAIIREKGVNGGREMAYALYLAGFDVKDVHMTDLISGNETLEDIHFIVFVGGFSNSDVLGSAKGWAGAFLYNPKAKNALDNFYKRTDSLSLGVCNGCQLMVELGLIYPEHPEKPKMLYNDSGKFESGFINVEIRDTNSVMLSSLAGSRLGVWIAHSEGKFNFPYYSDKYNIPMSYSYNEYPGNPNGSEWNTAAICSSDGRHLAMMPHLERSFLPWQWPYYPENRPDDEVTPWIEAFVNARRQIEKILVNY